MNFSQPFPIPQSMKALAELSVDQFYWMAPDRILERGLLYFEQGKIRYLNFDFKTNKLFANIEGTERYETIIWAKGQKLNQHCDCPAFEDSGHCKHAVCLAAAAFFLFQQKNFGNLPPAYYLERLFEPLLEKIARRMADNESEFSLDYTESSEKTFLKIRTSFQGILPSLEVSGQLPNPFLQKIARYPSSFQKESTLRLDFRDPGEDLLRILIAAQPYNIPIYYQDAEGKLVALKPEVASSTSQIVINLDTEQQIQATEIYFDEAGRTLQPILNLSANYSLLADGTFIEKYFNPAENLISICNPNTQYDYEFPLDNVHALFNKADADNKITAADFNQRMLLDALKPPLLDPKNVQFTFNRVERPPHTKEHETAKLSLHIEPDGEECYLAHLKMHCGGQELFTSQLADKLGADLQCYDIDPRLVSAKTRIRVLATALTQLPWQKTKKDCEALIKETAGHRCFQQLRLKSKAERFLKKFQKAWFSPSKKESLRLQALPKDKTPWRFVELPLAAFAHTNLTLLKPQYVEDFYEIGRPFVIAPSDFAAFLDDIHLSIRAWDIPIYFRGEPIEQQPLEITIQVTEDSKIDWFELKPEVRCGSLKMDNEQWEALIRGERLFEKDGHLVLIDLPPEQAIEHLRELFTSKKNTSKQVKELEAAVRIPRLEILDWLAYRRLGIQVNLPAPIEATYQALQNFKGIPTRKLPKSLSATLRKYQKDGYYWLAFLYENRFGACLADDMGLGKTVQAITLLAALKEGLVLPMRPAKKKQKKTPRYPHLLVVPPSLIFNWQQEVTKFCPSLTVEEYTGAHRDLDKALQADILLTTYDTVRRDIDLLEEHRFDVAIFDETQILKNLTSARTKAVIRLKRNFSLALTGTPLENHIGEYFSIMNIAFPGLLGDHQSFRQNIKVGNAQVLERTRPFILRRSKTEILSELPPKQEQDIYLEMSEEQKEVYTRTVGEVREEVLSAYEDKPSAQAGIIALAALTRLRQACLSPELMGKSVTGVMPKFEYLIDKLYEIREEGHAALVFSQYTRGLDLLEAHATAAKLPYLRMDGKTPLAQRKKLVERFQKEGEAPFFFISLKTGGVGLNLTRANYVFHLDPWWNPAVENQASDRAHRIGQQRSVFIQRLIIRHSIEEKMLELKKRKQQLFDEIVEAESREKNKKASLSAEDFQFLLHGD